MMNSDTALVAMTRPYGRPEFEHLWKTIDAFDLVADDSQLHEEWRSLLRVDESGVWLERDKFDSMPVEYRWTPWQELDPVAGQRPSPLSTPALPFPFDGPHLAAFFVDGIGSWLRRRLMKDETDYVHLWGNWGDAPDETKLRLLGDAGWEVQQAIREAWAAWSEATRHVGPWKESLIREPQQLSEEAKAASTEAERQRLRQRANEAKSAADAYEVAWRRDVVRHLLATPLGPTALVEQHGTSNAAELRQRNTAKQREDAMAMELDLVVKEMKAAKESISANSVMLKLKNRAGCSDSCISESGYDCVLWRRPRKIELEKLDMNALNARLNRMNATKK